jgi:hypothetical protein
MLSERRTKALRELAARAARVKTIEEACHATSEVLAGFDLDLPFGLLEPEQERRCMSPASDWPAISRGGGER